MWFKKKNKLQTPSCNHEWHKTLETKETTPCVMGGIVTDVEIGVVVFAYCPKCDTRKKFSEDEWTIVDNEQRIRKDYRDRIHQDNLITASLSNRLEEFLNNGELHEDKD